MISTRDPQTMTERERRDEVAGILAAGLLRCVRAGQLAPSANDEELCPGRNSDLIFLQK